MKQSNPLSLEKKRRKYTTKDVITVTGNKREISKENWKSSLSNNRDNCSFLFRYCKDSELSDFCVLKLDLLIW